MKRELRHWGLRKTERIQAVLAALAERLRDPAIPAEPGDPSALVIVCGPSCCGKSTFLHSSRSRRLLPDGAVSVTAHQYLASRHKARLRHPLRERLRRMLGGAPTPVREPSVIHYNTLRALQDYGSQAFADDPAWVKILAANRPLRAIVIMTGERLIWQRMLSRRFVEPNQDNDRPYPARRWADCYRRLDVAAHYRDWLDELERAGIPYEVRNGGRADFPLVVDIAAAIADVNLGPGPFESARYAHRPRRYSAGLATLSPAASREPSGDRGAEAARPDDGALAAE